VEKVEKKNLMKAEKEVKNLM